jgi:hypothetical protein
MRKSADMVLKVRLSVFYEAALSALEDDEVELIPMVSIVTKKGRRRKWDDFSVDYLLPVQIGDDWVGVVYRDGVPTQALMDFYDITNKALLCDPSFAVGRLSMFEVSRYHRLRIVPDLECSSTESAPSGRSGAEICESAQWTRTPSPLPVDQSPMYSMMMEMSPTPSAPPTLYTMPSFTPNPPRLAPPSIAMAPLISTIAMSFDVLPQSEQRATMQCLGRMLIDGKSDLSFFGKFLNGNRM